MTQRFDVDRPRPEDEKAGRPLPDAWIRSMKAAMTRETNPPGPTPADEMWRAIEARIGAGRDAGGSIMGRPLTRWALGLAASVVLLAGIAIGRGSVPTASPTPAPVAGGSPAGTGVDARVVRDVAARHLTASESLLSFVGVDVQRGDVDDDLASRGRRLLADTRMLLRVAPSEEVELRALLGDLELVLAQLALLDGADFDATRRAEEVDLLGAGLRGADLVPRIQAALPRLDARRRPMTSTD